MLATLQTSSPHTYQHSTQHLYPPQPSNPPLSKRSMSTTKSDREATGSSKPAHDKPSNPAHAKSHQGKQNAPGLITLSRPPEQGAGGAAPSKKGPSKKKKNVAHAPEPPTAAKPRKHAEEAFPTHSSVHQLSKSAPSGTVQDTNGSGLTWQQELLGSQKPDKKGERKGEKKKDKAPNKKPTKNKESEATSKSTSKESLTWQQEIFGTNKRGPAFDVFADAKDIDTFGESKPSHLPLKPKGKKGTGRRRADSLGDSHKQRTSSSLTGSPSTPNKLVYAGPTFHNSPSAASLPQPKFKKRADAPGNTSGLARYGDDTSSSDETPDEDTSFVQSRHARGETAPPQLGHDNSTRLGDAHPQTVEALMARMMQPI